jgi:ribulose-phosphate 3-epimerase
MPEVIEKIRLTRDYCDRNAIREGGIVAKDATLSHSLPPFDIQVDGGINAETGKECVEAGANILVSGNYLFHQPSLSEGIKSLKSLGGTAK